MEVNIPEGVIGINAGTFYCCPKIVSLKLPSTIKNIGNEAFIDCVSLESINIPGQCENIGNDAFSWCLALKTLTIEDGITPLELGYAYNFGPIWQSYMEPYYYPSKFYRGLFNDCPLKKLYVGRTIIYDNTGKLQSPFEFCTVKYDSAGKPIYFRNGKYYSNVEFGGMVTEIHSQLFKNAQIPNITLPNSLVRIGDKAFYDAITQSNITIPENCDSIGDYAFASSSTSGPLKNIECKPLIPPHIGSFSFDRQDVVVSVPKGKRTMYKTDKYWSKYFIYDADDRFVEVNLKYANSLYGKLSFMDLNPEDVYRLKVSGVLGQDDWAIISEMTNLYDLDLSDVTSNDISSISSVLSHLIHLKFPNGLKVIEKEQFAGSHLTGVLQIPGSCERIGANAFREAPITKLIINSPTVVEKMAFSFCTSLNEIEISGGAQLKEESFKYIMDVDNPNAGLETLRLGDDVIVEKNAFSDCSHLTNIIFEGKIDSVSNGAFANCKNVKNVTFNGSICKLASNVFDEFSISRLDINDLQSWCTMQFCTKMSNPMSHAEDIYINGSNEIDLILPEDNEEISNNAFNGCKSLKSVTIDGNTKVIGEKCFSGCLNLKKVSLSDNVKRIGNGAFEDCKTLDSVKLPVELSSISDSLFYGCENLADITIPKSIIEINKSAFSGCKSISRIEIPLTCNYIRENAFRRCMSLATVRIPYNVSAIGESAFDGCEGLKTVFALWQTPPIIAPTSFTNVNKKCILYVPVNTIPSYYENGWGRFPLIEEGYCVIYLNDNIYGSISYNKNNYTGDNNVIAIDINSDATLTVCPDNNFYIKNLKFDEKNIEPEMRFNVIELKNVTNNHTISVDYKKYVLGDVNDDNYIDVGDVSAIVRCIQKKNVDNFIAIAADVNMDNDIDVGDIRGEVNLIYNYANYSAKRRIKEVKLLADICEMKALINKNLNECIVTFSLGNLNDVSGIQMNIVVPQGWTVPKDIHGTPNIIFDEDGTSNMNIKNITQLNDTCYQILCASTHPICMKGNKNIFSLKLMNCGLDTLSSIHIPEIRISDSNANVIHSSTYITIENDNVNTGIVDNISNKDNISRKYFKDGHIFIRTENGTYNIDGYKYKK